ncbi:MAG: TAXI family TRAP transporter solute-binding subunit, partial [Chloroflexota bacterium]
GREVPGSQQPSELHGIAGWLSREMTRRSGPHTRIAIWSGRGHVDNVRAVGRGEVDIALVTPASFARMAVAGSGPYARDPYPDLVALGTIPASDRLLFAVSAGTGIRTFKDLREDRPPLRFATAPNDGIHHVGMGVANVLERSGVSRQAIEGWGGRFIELEDARRCTEAVLNGEADAVLHAGISEPGWSRLAAERAMNFIPIEAEVGAHFEKVGWPRATVAKGALRGITEELATMDFSDVLLVCRKDLPEDVAYLAAWCLAETFDGERLDPKRVATATLPLHPWARSYYESVGALTAAS